MFGVLFALMGPIATARAAIWPNWARCWACDRARLRRYRLEAARLGLRLGPITALAKVQESRGASGAAGGGGGLEWPMK
jgi:hypothetical protein